MQMMCDGGKIEHFDTGKFECITIKRKLLL